MKKLIIHIGYHKTATTTLQMNLFTLLHDKGYIEYLNHTNLIDDNLEQFNVKNIVDFILGSKIKKNEIKDELNSLKSI